MAPKRLRRGDRLQAGNAHPHDEHLRRRHRAGRRHHHRKGAAELLRRIDHRPVARQIRLAREHVHRLRPRDARHQFHGEGHDAGVRHLLQGGLVAVGVHDGDDQRALLVALQLLRRRPLDLEHHVGVLGHVVANAGARRLVVGVQYARRQPGAARDRDLRPQRLQLLYGLRCPRYPRFRRVCFRSNYDSHSASTRCIRLR